MKIAAPALLAPSNGTTTADVPAFAWKPVAGADQYEFQIAADRGFNSPLGGSTGDFVTRNTRATLKKTLPDSPPLKPYWWRVRAVAANGGNSAWSAPRSFIKRWGAAPALDASDFVFPTSPLRLHWSPVAGARKYLVTIGNDFKAETTANEFTPTAPLAPGTLTPKVYSWSVTPVDAEGNPGATSASRFTLFWPSGTTATVADLDPADAELFDPKFSWKPVAGAARYEVEINTTSYFAPGSKVCCNGTTIATSLSPTTLLKDNRYYWRVRPLDADGNPGVWTTASEPFTKAFDKVPPAGTVSGTSIKNLRMRDIASDVGTDEDPATSGFQTYVPIARWDPVPGASSYIVQVFPFKSGACAWGNPALTVKTSVTAWTPLGNASANPTLFPRVAMEGTPLLRPDTYCLSVTARSDRVGLDEIYGDPTYLRDGNVASTVATGPAFTWAGYPSAAPASAKFSRSNGCVGADGVSRYLCSGDYRGPARQSPSARVPTTPLFTWNSIAGATGYFVVIAKDQNFSNIVDEAFTRVPAYAPRNPLNALGTTTYPDELTSYYWQVLPSYDAAGTGSGVVPFDPTGASAAPADFLKQSNAPHPCSLDSAACDPTPCGTSFSGQPSFRWSPAVGARSYELQVARDPSFGNPLEDVVTDATSYSSNSTYPQTTLYWRVRANDENGIGLSWSDACAFQKSLQAPVVAPVSCDDTIPTFTWSPVDGAVGYDVSVDLPDGSHRDLNGLRTPALTPVLMYGTGVFSWRVRAEFPKSPFGATPGPYSPQLEREPARCVRTIREPIRTRVEAAIDHILLSWNEKPQVRGYEVQVSAQPSFIQPLEIVRTDNTSYAPPLRFVPIKGLDTGRLYWRVAALDEGNNLGDWAAGPPIVRTRRMYVTAQGSLKRRRRSLLMVSVKNFESGAVVPGVRLRISGAGIRPRTVRASGLLLLRLRPTRRGLVHITASARGYRRAQANARVN